MCMKVFLAAVSNNKNTSSNRISQRKRPKKLWCTWEYSVANENIIIIEVTSMKQCPYTSCPHLPTLHSVSFLHTEIKVKSSWTLIWRFWEEIAPVLIQAVGRFSFCSCRTEGPMFLLVVNRSSLSIFRGFFQTVPCGSLHLSNGEPPLCCVLILIRVSHLLPTGENFLFYGGMWPG